MDTDRRASDNGLPESAWCTRAVWRLLIATGTVEEAATALYRSGLEGLTQTVNSLLDVEAIGYTNEAAAGLVTAVLRQTGWARLAEAAATRYDPEAEYYLVQIDGDGVALRTAIYRSREEAFAIAVAAAQAPGSHGFSPCDSVLEVRRHPRHPSPFETIRRVAIGEAPREEQWAG